jgi:hypothetical protein
MEQSFTRPSLSGFFPDSRIESHFLINMCNQEAITQYWRTKFEEEQSAKQSLADELAEEKDRNQILTNELSDEQSANNSLADELAEEQNVLQILDEELKKEKAISKNIAYDHSKELSVSHRLRLERIVYMVCFSFGAISILMYDWCAKLF